jgi:hypothetical protein
MAARTTVLVPSTVHPDTGMRVARRLQECGFEALTTREA